jgi:hypothetical protein
MRQMLNRKRLTAAFLAWYSLAAAGLGLARATPPTPATAAAPAPPAASADPPDNARKIQDLTALEEAWLHARDAATLERILADDFVHPVPQGYFLTKGEHIEWFRKHPPAAGRQERFESLQIRILGLAREVGIATGIVLVTTPGGREERSVFTDVFVERDGRWQAVNAQENPVLPRSSGR